MLRIIRLQVRNYCTSTSTQTKTGRFVQVPQISESIPGSKLFNKAFGKYLFITNIAVGGVLMGVGDLVQQEIEYRRHMLNHRYNWARLARMFLIGFSMGPMHHYFYKYLDNYLPKRNFFSISKKILLDQLLMSPACIAWFFYGMGILEGKNMVDITTEINGKFVEVYVIDWSVWPPTQFINFYFLPVQYQVLYINMITMVYNVFLSFMKHKEEADLIRQTLEVNSPHTQPQQN